MPAGRGGAAAAPPVVLEELAALTVVLTSRCNLACSYCYQDRKGPARMSWPTLRRALDLLLASPRRRVSLFLYGGEPLLELGLAERALDHVRRHRRPGQRVRRTLSTNGTLLRPEVASWLARRRVYTQLSFDGVAAAQDQRGRGTFAVLDRLLDHLRDRHPRYLRDQVRVATTVTPRSLPHLAESVRYFLVKGVKTIRLGVAFTHQPDWAAEDIASMRHEMERVYRLSLRHWRRTGEIPVEVFRRPPGPPPGGGARHVCGILRGESLTVGVDGQVHGCVTLVDSYQTARSDFLRPRLRALRLGPVASRALPRRLERFGDAVRAAGIFTYLEDKRSSYGRCRDCPHLMSCTLCPAAIGHIPGNDDPDRVPDFNCAFHRVTLDCRARFPPWTGARRG